MLALCINGHHGQTRKYSGLPYSVHPIEVAMLARDYSLLQKLNNHNLLYEAGLGHDLLEDTRITENEIRSASSEEVLSLIKELTNPSKGSSLSRRKRKEIDRKHILSISREAKIIKLIDRTCNLLDMSGAESEFKQLYLEESGLLLNVLEGTSFTLELKYQYAMEGLYRTL